MLGHIVHYRGKVGHIRRQFRNELRGAIVIHQTLNALLRWQQVLQATAQSLM